MWNRCAKSVGQGSEAGSMKDMGRCKTGAYALFIGPTLSYLDRGAKMEATS